MAVDRKQQMKEITERLEQGVKDIFTSEMYTTYLRTMAKFHNYSFNNTLLIAMQRPDATLVAGFNAWKNKFNRYVKKGEKGIQIIAPAPIKEVEEREKIDKDTGLAVLNENGEPEMERVEYVVPRFRVTTVFDVSQTDGEPIPSLEVNELTASVKDYALLTAAIEQVSPVPMRFDEIEGDAKGYYSDADKEICIQVGMGESQTIKTMIHEVAHAMLHNSDIMKQHGEEKDRLTKETEAESIAFTGCSALGIDTSDYSFPYVASWASGKEMKELKDSMDTIRLTAADFLEKLEAAIAERSAERMTAMQYAEKLIADKEQKKTIFDDEQRNLIVNFAFKLDDRAATEELVSGLTAALAEDDKEEVNRLMYDAQEKIENLPDGMIGLSEMHDYGYLKDDVFPLTKEGAREWHRLGERIYPLFRDGTVGDYVSQEGIEQHDGIFGIKTDAWDAILLEQREDYAEDEYARPDFPLTVIDREQALRLYDEGKQIYLVRISPWPILVTAREEIERGSDTFQIAIADLEQERNMTEQENMLLDGSEKQFGIYQITTRDPEHDYRFMGLDFVRKKSITVARADYDLIYAAPLTEKDTLDGIYERFNIQRPADFTGHSLSVSDVVVLNDGSTVKAYYVDSIGFAELPEFFKERNIDLQKENLLNEELQEIEIFDKPGLFSNGRLRDEDVPEGLYRYDLRGSDYDPGQPITVEKTVVVNHAASVLMAEELDLGAEGRLELGEEGLNFTGAELTVREFMEEQQQKRNGLIHGDSDHIAVEGHIGTWYAIDETEIGGEKFFLLEHEEHGDMAACVAVNEQGKLVAEDLWNGIDDDFLDAVKEYLSEKWNMPNTLYNKDFTERDGGILETDGDKSVQDAMTELLTEFGCDAAEGRVMDAAELREQADTVAEQQAEVLKEKLAAERPAPEETLSFYVAECLEFTFAGEFHDHLTMEEALEVYDKIPSERMNANKCIGFCIEENGGFVGMYELVVDDKVQRENINSINYFRDDKLVQQAISDMEKLMAARQQSKEQERSNTKKSVLDALRSLKAKKQEQPAQEQDKPKKAKTKGMEL